MPDESKFVYVSSISSLFCCNGNTLNPVIFITVFHGHWFPGVTRILQGLFSREERSEIHWYLKHIRAALLLERTEAILHFLFYFIFIKASGFTDASVLVWNISNLRSCKNVIKKAETNEYKLVTLNQRFSNCEGEMEAKKLREVKDRCVPVFQKQREELL